MATGQRAFSGKTPEETLSAVMEKQPPSPSTLVPSLPHDLERTILRCLRKEPAKRFQTMADVRIDLAEIKEVSESSGASPTLTSRPRLRWLAVAAASAVIGVAVAAWYFWPQRHEAAPMHVVPLTTMTGHAMWPSFSPDGQQVVFGWQPDGQHNSSIYVKLIGVDDMRRLTADPANDRNPIWSPDGRQIAFLRDGPHDTAIHLVSPLGGGLRKVSDFRVHGLAPIAWSPDSRYLAASGSVRSSDKPSDVGIYLIPLDHGDPRLITAPHLQCDTPAWSPDGHGLAYVSREGGATLDVVTLDSTFTATGPPRRLVPHVSDWIFGMTWSRDGRQVIYSDQQAAGVTSLWRVHTDGGTPPERIEITGPGALWPAIGPSTDRLVFSRDLGVVVPYRFEAGQPSRPLLTSSPYAGSLDYSPDGHRVTYCANSGGTMEIWTARADGSTPLQLTRGPGRWQCSPRWSPDGRQIAFDSQGNDYQWHIWTIAADGGGAPRRVSSDSGNVPTWSRDGQWIYYSGKNADLWRIQVADGRKQQLTHEGNAVLATESADGKTFVYQERSSLLTMPVAGGPSHQIVPRVGLGRLDHAACDLLRDVRHAIRLGLLRSGAACTQSFNWR
jgi:eukaryotic-like serine/threonine-protein kinase